MSVSRRMVVAGLPAAGVTVFAALAFTGGPAAAVSDTAARPVAMASPCVDGDRTNCSYPDDTGTPGGAGPDDTRGNPGYGGESPATTPPTTTTTPPTAPTTPTGTYPTGTSPVTLPPTAVVDSVPPVGESPETSPPGTSPATSPSEGPYGELAVTGPPMGAVFTLGGLLVAVGAASVFYTRRRRSV